MADRDILREYLVKIGYQVDKGSEKRFVDGLENAAKGIAKLVALIESAALAIGAGVAKFASGMEELYFSARKANSSASNLKAFEKAAVNFGASTADALQSVKGLASFLRSNPGAEAFLQGMGISTRGKNGQMRDTADMIADLSAKFRAMPFHLAQGYAKELGLTEDMLLAITSGDFGREFERQRDMMKDSGFDKAAEDAHAFEVKLRELQSRIEVIGVKIGTSLLDALGPQMDQAAKWFEKNSDKIGSVVAGVANAVLVAANLITPILGKVADGWKNIYDWVKAAGEAINRFIPSSMGDKIGAGVAGLLDKLGIRSQVDALLGFGSSSGASNAALDPTKFFMGLGWSKAQAAGIVANLRAESNMNPSAVGDNGQAYGVAQWHPDRQANFKRWSGKDIRDSTLEDQLKFVNYELTSGAERKAGDFLRAAQNAQQAGEVVSRYYERPMAADAEALRRGAAAVQIAQNTTINVSGTSDPAAAGRAVAGEQGRVNQQLARNLQTAVN